MRKYEKKMAEDFLASLPEAHDEIRRFLEKGELDPVRALLAQCQEGAIALGNLIERTEGEACPVVGLLEEYCEQVYRFYEGLGQADAFAATERLQTQVKKIEHGVKSDVKVRLEVVFLPYMASMWDSLESVWRAADADPDCDAYVIPIPYYEHNEDKSFGAYRYRYEGAEFPADVPITHYTAYSIEKRRPDMIYIHNPYDNRNYVTSVDPQFYSSELKKWTECLVYIPYFVIEEVDSKAEAAVERIAHFYNVPGVLEADRVIVQSENIRQLYVRALTEKFGEQTRGRWEQKILGLGSPKFDKVQTIQRKDVEIPPDWLRIIEKPNRSWKKIVFYNISIDAFLHCGDKMLKKIEDVLRIFQKSQEEVTLLWRPHPLLQATIESMRPQLWWGYQAIVKRYRAENWGIYDDTADINRAIAISDAYYGDGGSVAVLYQKKGKPVLFQNVEILVEDETSQGKGENK